MYKLQMLSDDISTMAKVNNPVVKIVLAIAC